MAERSSIDRLYASYMYDSPVGEALKALKFDDIRAVGPILGEMFDVTAMSRVNADYVIPVPLHRSKMRSRGYNQSELLGRRLAKRLGVAFRGDVLVKTLDTLAQSAQPTAADRNRALVGAFEVVHEVSGQRVLLVDDIFTTGSTAKACASALKASGAEWVGIAALAVQPIGALK